MTWGFRRSSFLVCCLLLLILENSSSLSTASFDGSSCTAKTMEDRLVEHAVPLSAAISKVDASKQLIKNGVCRINEVVSEEKCSELRDYLLGALEQGGEDNTGSSNSIDISNVKEAPPSIPNTRLNCGAEPILVSLNHRTDILVPLEHPRVRDTLQNLVEEFGEIYEEVVQTLLPQDKTSASPSVQLLEAGSLVSQTGATHQQLHPDFRRDANQKESRLPPRLVTFLYLQDTPTKEHGPTIFLPRTNTPGAHRQWASNRKNNEDENKSGMLTIGHNENSEEEQCPAVAATLSQGDVAIYDASLLHFGSANHVNGNTRAVFYLSIGFNMEKDTSAGLSRWR